MSLIEKTTGLFKKKLGLATHDNEAIVKSASESQAQPAPTPDEANAGSVPENQVQPASPTPVRRIRRRPPTYTPTLTSDEGIPFAWTEPYSLITNLALNNLYDQRRRELHVDGKTFSHVGENAERQWIYRHD